HVAAAVALRAGSRAASDTAGSPLAWPRSADLDRAAQGAVPWQGLDAADLLAASRWGGQRTVVVDQAWLTALLAEGRLDQIDGATALRLDDLDGLDDWFSVLDADHDLSVVGPWTWVEDVDPGAYSAVDVEAGLVAGRTVASTGPRVALRVDGQGPGSLIRSDTGAPSSVVSVSLRVETPAWAPIQHVSLRGRGGVVLLTLDVAPGPVPVETSFDLDRTLSDWIVVVAQGDQASPLTGRLPWSVTSPVWIE
ncbi:MAG: hypothetical protein GXP62_17350, partial [Oligoflexia bacterium]|nr:hypothetical protein [Oligoflexia bacterium]